jgi:hypothetical protein
MHLIVDFNSVLFFQSPTKDENPLKSIWAKKPPDSALNPKPNNIESKALKIAINPFTPPMLFLQFVCFIIES